MPKAAVWSTGVPNQRFVLDALCNMVVLLLSLSISHCSVCGIRVRCSIRPSPVAGEQFPVFSVGARQDPLLQVPARALELGINMELDVGGNDVCNGHRRYGGCGMRVAGSEAIPGDACSICLCCPPRPPLITRRSDSGGADHDGQQDASPTVPKNLGENFALQRNNGERRCVPSDLMIIVKVKEFPTLICLIMPVLSAEGAGDANLMQNDASNALCCTLRLIGAPSHLPLPFKNGHCRLGDSRSRAWSCVAICNKFYF